MEKIVFTAEQNEQLRAARLAGSSRVKIESTPEQRARILKAQAEEESAGAANREQAREGLLAHLQRRVATLELVLAAVVEGNREEASRLLKGSK